MKWNRELRTLRRAWRRLKEREAYLASISCPYLARSAREAAVLIEADIRRLEARGVTKP